MVTACSKTNSSRLDARPRRLDLRLRPRDERIRTPLRVHARKVAVAHGAHRLLERAGAGDSAARTQRTRRRARAGAPHRRGPTPRVTPPRSPPTSPARAASTSCSRRFAGVALRRAGARRPPQFRAASYQWQYVLTGADRVPDRFARAAGRDSHRDRRLGRRPERAGPRGKRPLTYNAIDNSRDVKDVVGHGTFVASLAAGSASNGEGMAGSRARRRLITIKASSAGMFTDFEVAAAIAYAVDTGAKVVNLSLGGSKSSQTERAGARVRARQGRAPRRRRRQLGAGGKSRRVSRRAPPAGRVERRRRVRALRRRIDDHRRARRRSRTTARTSRSPPRAKRSSARSRRIRRRKDFPRVDAARLGEGALRLQQRHVVLRAAGRRRCRARLGGELARSARARSRTSSSRPRRAAASWNPELGYGVINVAAAVAVAR